ncbi:hypothetical protein [Bartonella sp. B1099]|uniref:hypothetical protein n=1 Tax=Bartonella sp. B1099 TaxID=2911422 RepID=UPI0020C1CF68|nr:hypothetical protein [Bartonella sp. B1099]
MRRKYDAFIKNEASLVSIGSGLFFVSFYRIIYIMELLWKGINYDGGTLGNNSIIIMDILCKSRKSFAIVVGTFYLKNNLLKRLTKIKNFGPVILAQFF